VTRMTPRGNPTTSTERMRIKALRDRGVLPPVPNCTHPGCNRQLKFGAGHNKAFAAGLCWEHWRESEEGRLARREQNLLTENWAVSYFSAQGDGPIERHPDVRAAIGKAYFGKGKPRNPVYVVWRDGTVTVYADLSVRAAKGLTPEQGIELSPSDPLWADFRSQVPEKARTWFKSSLS